MLDTYLVQRLSKKPENEFQAKATQAFGGGMLQLSPEAWKLLQGIFNFVYMGAAEYEFGTIPQALKRFSADAAELITFELVLQRKDVAVQFGRKFSHELARRAELKKAKAAGVKPPRAKPFKDPNFTPKTVYVLCRKKHREDVENVIRALALDKVHTECVNMFSRALDPVEKYDSETIGWLELDNGFFFFTDKEVFEATRDLFQVKE